MDEDLSWQSPSYRNAVVKKLNEVISSSNLTLKKNTVDMENEIFRKARNKDEYLSFVARIIIHIRGYMRGNTSQTGNQPGMQVEDLINAFQNLLN